MRDVDQEGEAVIAGFEGEVHHIYWDQAGVATVCVGHALKSGEETIYAPGENIPHATCEAILKGDLRGAVSDVNRFIKPEVLEALPQQAFNGLVDFQFNTGALGLPSCSVTKRLNVWDFDGAASAMLLWNHRKDPKTGLLVADPGLTRRRQLEAQMLLSARTGRIPAATLADQISTYHLELLQFDLRPDVLSPLRPDEDAPETPRNDVPFPRELPTIPNRRRES